jgi:hypothetical protein
MAGATLGVVGLKTGVAASWQLVIALPVWLYLLYVYVLRVSIRVELDADLVTWRSPLVRGTMPIAMIASVSEGKGNGRDVMRIFEGADGRRFYVTEGGELDRLLRELRLRGCDVELAGGE